MSCAPASLWCGLLESRRFFGFCIILGIVFRCYVAFASSFWLDELWSSWWSAPQHSLQQVIDFALADVHPPLYQILLHYWFQVFGFSEISGRMLSLGFGLLALPAFHFLAKVLYEESVARVATIVFALSPSAAAFAAEVRSYEMLLLLSITSTACFAAWFTRRHPGYLAGYFLSALAVVYTHYFGLILLLTHGVAWLFLLGKCAGRRGIWYPAPVFLLLLAGFLPLFQSILDNMGRETFWISNPALWQLLAYVPIYFGGPFALPLLLVVVIILLRDRPSFRLQEYLLLLAGVLALLVPWLLGFVISPIITARNTIIAVPYWNLLAAYVGARASPSLRGLFLASCVLIAILGTILTPVYKGEDINRLLDAIVARPAPVYLVKTAELETDTFLQTKIALNGDKYRSISFVVPARSAPIQTPVFWLACYHTCNKVNLEAYLPAGYRLIREVTGKGVRGLLVESAPAVPTHGE